MTDAHLDLTAVAAPDASAGDDPAETLAAAEALLEEQLLAMAAVLTESGSGAEASPLGVDLVAELGLRLRVHGKRLRPQAAHWGWVAGGGADRAGTRASLVTLCAALELLHLFALVHDDVMDRSDLRRGLPTLHAQSARRHRAVSGLGSADRFGDAVAILLGDLVLAEAQHLVGGLPDGVRRRWRGMLVELVEGQLLDVTRTADRSRSARLAAQTGRLKSGRYTVRRPVELGAAVAGADTVLVGSLGEWGDLVGDAFALRDDVIGVWGDPARSGKPSTADLRSAKPTLLLAWATETLRSSTARDLLAACDRGELTDDGAAALAAAMERAGLRERAERRVEALLTDAGGVLSGLAMPASARAGLTRLAHASGRRSR